MRKSSMMMSGLRIIRSKLTEDQFLKVATAQYYRVINYACQVWSTPSLNGILKKKLDVAHYKLLRLTIQDYKKDYPREMLDLIGRAKPTQWAGYAVSSLVVNVVASGRPIRLREKILKNEYVERRRPRMVLFYSSAKKRIGQQAIQNRLARTMELVHFDWRYLEQDWRRTKGNEYLRRNLKASFFPD